MKADLDSADSAAAIVTAARALVFEHCRVDTARRELQVHGRVVPTQPLVYALLQYFLTHPGRVIAKQELMLQVWRSPVVTDSAVARAVMKMRRVLSDTDTTPLISTVHGAGYRFNAIVHTEGGTTAFATAGVPARSSAAPPAQSVLERLAPRTSLLAPPGPAREAAPYTGRAFNGAGQPLAQGESRSARVQSPVSDMTGLWRVLLQVQDTADGADIAAHDCLADWLLHLLRRHDDAHWVPMRSVKVWRAGAADPLDLAGACYALRTTLGVRCKVTFEHDRVLLDAVWGRVEGRAQYRRFAGGSLDSVARQLSQALANGPIDDPDVVPANGTELPALAFWQQQCLRCFVLERQGLDEQALALLESCLPHLPPNPLLALLHVRLLLRRLQTVGAREAAEAALRTLRSECDSAATAALHAELADIALNECDLAQAEHHCQLAMQAAAEDEGSLENVPQVLQIQATVHNLRGEHTASLALLTRARELTQASGDLRAQLRVLTALGYQWMDVGRVDDAERAFSEVIADASAADMPGVEAQAYLCMSMVHTKRRERALAVDASRKASTLSRLVGDLRYRQLARTREVLALTDAGLLDQAAARLTEPGNVRNDAPATLAAIRLAWRQGDLAAAADRWRQLFEHCLKTQSRLRWTAGASLLRSRVALGQFDVAKDLWRELRHDPNRARRGNTDAVLAHALGELANCQLHLRRVWKAQGVRTPAGQDAALNLAWLLLEQGRLHEEPALQQAVQAVTADYAPARLLQHVLQCHAGLFQPSAEAWRILVDATLGLARRHNWLRDDPILQRPRQRARRLLTELLCEACY